MPRPASTRLTDKTLTVINFEFLVAESSCVVEIPVPKVNARHKSKYILLGWGLVIFVSGVYFDSKLALLIGSIYTVFAILGIEIRGND